MTTVRTRFAPSPTGYLHIGGVRTALFCWLFARQHGPDGKFVLRIDDTDAERNVDEALAPILHGLKWMGIDWDEGPEVGGPYGPYFQAQRQSLYQDAARELIERGAAYRDYARTEELQAERDAAQAAGGSFIYSRRWMAETPADCARFEAEGRTGVVRLKMPREGKLVIADLIRGNVEFDWAREQDHVIQRANGSCLYHLASVVDDHEMQITHVIRAEEHLSNTPRQIFILESLGYTRPVYAHLPYVAEPGSKTKLSKRKLDKYLKNRDFAALAEQGQTIAKAIGIGASADTFNPVIVDFYEQIGFLPEAVLNYLLLLGWSLDDTREFFTRQEMIESFSLDRVNKAPASFDPRKLLAFQDHYMRQVPARQKVELVVPYLERAGYVSQPATAADKDRALKVVEAAGDRIKLAGDVLDYPEFFVADDSLVYDEKAVEKRLRKDTGAPELLAAFRSVLADISPFDAATIEHAMDEFMAGRGLRPGDIVHALRVAVTGKEVGIGLFDTLAILGRDSCLMRLDRALELAA